VGQAARRAAGAHVWGPGAGADVHTLFDRGYVTITPDSEFRASGRLREEFDNGEEYFAIEDSELWLPPEASNRPTREFLQWHSEEMFLG
jgi:putative restriction endonuclease